MPTLLVVSHASVNAPHRKPFDVLASRESWRVHIAAPASIRFGAGEKRCDPAPPSARYVLHQLRMRGGAGGRTTWFSGLGTLLRELRPEAVFLEYDPGSLVVVEAWATAQRPRPALICFSVENIERDRWRETWAALRRRELRAAARDCGVGLLEAAGRKVVSGLACINAEGVRIFRDVRGWTQPVELMPIGTDLELFRPMDASATRRELGLEQRFVVGYFGRLIPEKGVHLLVEALAELPEPVRLLLDMFKNFEPGSYAHGLLQRAEQLGVRDRIATIDVPHGEVPKYMNACDVIALPSLSSDRWKEQFGRVIPEAMACGVPVIGSDSGNIPDLIGDAGVIVPEGSSEALVEAIGRLQTDEAARARLRTIATRRVTEQLSVQHQAQVLERVLRDSLRA